MSRFVDAQQLADADLLRAGLAGFGRTAGQLEEWLLESYVAIQRSDPSRIPYYVTQSRIAALELARRAALEA